MKHTKEKNISSETLTQLIVEGMQEKKAKDILILDLREIPQAVADYFVIATGNVDTHVDAIQQEVRKGVYETANERPWHTEGLENRQWVLLDYVDVVAHIFLESKRGFYQLEQLWGDARQIPITTPQKESI